MIFTINKFFRQFLYQNNILDLEATCIEKNRGLDIRLYKKLKKVFLRKSLLKILVKAFDFHVITIIE